MYLMPRRYRKKGNVCAKVSPDNFFVPNVSVMWRLFTHELHKTAHKGQEAERFLAFITTGKL